MNYLLNKIFNEDCLITMGNMPDNFIDLVVTSPPYDKLRSYNNSLDFTFKRFKQIAKELYRVMKPGGVIVWVVNDATIKGSETGTSFKQALYFMQIGFLLNDTMIYAKKNPSPAVNNIRYQPRFEYMFVFCKNEKPKAFNVIRVKSKNPGVNCSTATYYNSNDSKHFRHGKKDTVNNTKYKTNIWLYGLCGRMNNKVKHPAKFPKQLAIDHIISWSNENDVVYDPFTGSGTTCNAAKELNRKYIGSEMVKQYCIDIKKQSMLKVFKSSAK